MDMIDEQYNDILPFEEYHLKEAIKSIFHEETTLEKDPYNSYQSNCLIFINAMARYRILGENVFNNIALVDTYPEIVLDTSNIYQSSFGLILFMVNFKGILQIGG